VYFVLYKVLLACTVTGSTDKGKREYCASSTMNAVCDFFIIVTEIVFYYFILLPHGACCVT